MRDGGAETKLDAPNALELVLAWAPGPHANEAPTLGLSCGYRGQRGGTEWGK